VRLCAKRGKLGLALDAVEPSSSAAALGSGISPRRSWTAAQIWSHGSLGRHFAANGRSVSGANGAILALNWGRAAGARARAAMCGEAAMAECHAIFKETEELMRLQEQQAESKDKDGDKEKKSAD